MLNFKSWPSSQLLKIIPRLYHHSIENRYLETQSCMILYDIFNVLTHSRIAKLIPGIYYHYGFISTPCLLRLTGFSSGTIIMMWNMLLYCELFVLIYLVYEIIFYISASQFVQVYLGLIQEIVHTCWFTVDGITLSIYVPLSMPVQIHGLDTPDYLKMTITMSWSYPSPTYKPCLIKRCQIMAGISYLNKIYHRDVSSVYYCVALPPSGLAFDTNWVARPAYHSWCRRAVAESYHLWFREMPSTKEF